MYCPTELQATKALKSFFKTATSARILDKSIVNILSQNDSDFIQLFEEVVRMGQLDGSITKSVDSFNLATFLYASHHGIRAVQNTKNDSKTLDGILNTLLILIKA